MAKFPRTPRAVQRQWYYLYVNALCILCYSTTIISLLIQLIALHIKVQRYSLRKSCMNYQQYVPAVYAEPAQRTLRQLSNAAVFVKRSHGCWATGSGQKYKLTRLERI